MVDNLASRHLVDGYAAALRDLPLISGGTITKMATFRSTCGGPAGI